jgi:hypothetical protein
VPGVPSGSRLVHDFVTERPALKLLLVWERPAPNLWGAFIRFSLVSRAFWTWGRTRVQPWKAPEIRRRTRRHPFEVEREALRVGPRVLNRTRPSRGNGSPRGGTRPPSHELPARLERHQVSGPISISAPLRRRAASGGRSPSGLPRLVHVSWSTTGRIAKEPSAS